MRPVYGGASEVLRRVGGSRQRLIPSDYVTYPVYTDYPRMLI
jgi:hypothetical protein